MRNELSQAGIAFERQKDMPLRYKDALLDCGYRLDFVVAGSLIIEIKAVGELHPLHEAQLLTYLKLDGKSLGLLINFNVAVLKEGVKRVASGDLFRPETPGQNDLVHLLKLLCASVPLWFK